jgi:hypothetical protein
MSFARIMVLSAAMSLSLAAAGQQKVRPSRPKLEVIDFDETTIKGRMDLPPSTYTLVRPKTGFANLIKTRASFVPELQKSTDNL